MTTPKRDKFESLKHGWYLWLFPVVAFAISGYFVFDYFREQGPRVHIDFDDAASIQVDKTTVRFRGVAIGTVRDVHLSKDEKGVTAEIQLRKDAAHFAVEGSRFSMVKPKVNFQGISGLDTLIEGTYITVLPGPADAAPKFDFKAQSSSGTDPQDDTSGYLIETEDVESISVGDAVTFRGMRIGSVTRQHFTKGAQLIQVQINVENRFTYLIRSNTVFWRKVGVQAKLGLFGASFKMNSMDSIMNGGVQLATPNAPGPMAKAMQKFGLAAEAPKDLAKWKPVLE